MDLNWKRFKSDKNNSTNLSGFELYFALVIFLKKLLIINFLSFKFLLSRRNKYYKTKRNSKKNKSQTKTFRSFS